MREALGTRLCGYWGFDKEHEFASDAVANGELFADLGDGAAKELLVELRELARGNDAQGRSEDGFDVDERAGDAMRRFVKNQGLRGVARLRGQGFEASTARAGFLGEESDEVEFLRGET